MSETTGRVDFVVSNETYQTWYKVYGDLKSGVRPLVTLHGGPGIPHQYLLPHIDLCKLYSIPVVFYDQIGCGESTHLPDKPKEFWRMDLFLDELENLVARLGIQNNFDVLGHSAGGRLAASLACYRHPPGLKRLVIFSSPASMKFWVDGCRSLLAQLPEDVQDVIRKHEEAGTTDDPEYQKATGVFFARHVCRIDPQPQDLQTALAAMAAEPTVYRTMNGPSEWCVTGPNKDWTIIDDLHRITTPTLLINGAYDEATDLCVSPYFRGIAKVKWVKFANSSHLACFEERERYMQVVADFLKM
ncbi:proline-specific peptidase [Laetiporus sulphureus 93-53]|uniref:Proline-specific peptidase n=1 Tax=Laetiporus sulphureus 93-53 TaxID=1314785 RepID=A0A165EZ55_9APHY|nr:proline-specific peptidase [Laetiporus sulphureus 93-53]KZT08023.1 proline-specific peptidase [Laetiporus sulphureus 93-53]